MVWRSHSLPSVCAVAIALFVAIPGPASSQTARLTQFDVGVAGGPAIATLSIVEVVHEWADEEYPRLSALCGTDVACWRRSMRSRQSKIADVFAVPDDNGQRIGSVVLLARAMTSPDIGFVFAFEMLDGSRSEWVEAFGDWGYGTTVYFRESRPGNWVRLPVTGVPSAWVKVAFDSRGLQARLEPFEGLVEIPAGLPAIDRRTGRATRLPVLDAPLLVPVGGTAYLIERVTKDGWVYIRREVPADMPCGEPVSEQDVATPSTPRYRIRLDSLFDKMGRPLIATPYPKGC